MTEPPEPPLLRACSASVILGEAARDGVEIPAAHGRLVTAAGPMGTAMRVYRNPNRFTITPIPTPPPENPPTVQNRDTVGAIWTPSDDPPPLPSR